jgi:hypothetical protein
MSSQGKKKLLITSLISVSLVLLTVFAILIISDKDFREFKSASAVIFASLIILIVGIVRHKTLLSGDELQKTIQLRIFSFTHTAFLTFLTLFGCLQIAYNFKLAPMDVLLIVLFGTSIFQTIISFFVKQKYK